MRFQRNVFTGVKMSAASVIRCALVVNLLKRSMTKLFACHVEKEKTLGDTLFCILFKS